MPCTKCEEGNYKWGETGECKYDTLQDCESANHKYNKMQPTPLGKTYEEYAKELKEYNLSKVERIELGITDDIDKLFSQSKEDTKDFLNTRKKLSDIAADKNTAAAKLNRKAEALRKKFESAAKELGIDVKKSEAYKKIEAAVERFSEIQGGFARMSAKIYQEKL